ncbi:hypothetical protein CaCOL14_007252 [Colletotrichum acutatum]
MVRSRLARRSNRHIDLANLPSPIAYLGKTQSITA